MLRNLPSRYEEKGVDLGQPVPACEIGILRVAKGEEQKKKCDDVMCQYDPGHRW